MESNKFFFFSWLNCWWWFLNSGNTFTEKGGYSKTKSWLVEYLEICTAYETAFQREFFY